MTINIPGLVSIIVFYLLILAIGLYGAWKKRQKGKKSQNENERAMVGERDFGLFVLGFTMTGIVVFSKYLMNGDNSENGNSKIFG